MKPQWITNTELMLRIADTIPDIYQKSTHKKCSLENFPSMQGKMKSVSSTNINTKKTNWAEWVR